MNDTPHRPGGPPPDSAPGSARDAAFAAALDAALRRELQAPDMPAGFRERLRAAIVRAPQLDHERLRRELEREQYMAMAELRAGTVRMSREVSVVLVAVIFITGFATARWLPELAQSLDLDQGQLAAIACAVAAIGFAAWVARRPLASRVMRWLG